MSNSYKYIDPDFTYTDPKTGLLRNLQDITDICSPKSSLIAHALKTAIFQQKNNS